MKETKLGIYTYNDKTHNFNFVTNLSANKKRIFVRTVVGALIDGMDYDSVLRDIIFDYTTILMFTDINMSFIRTKGEDGEVITDMELLEEFLLETDIVEIVRANAFPTLFEELNKAVDKSIEYRTGIHPSPIADSLASLINTLEKKINEIDLNSAMEMAQKFSGMTSEFNLDNLVNAYMNSDLHQKNLDEITESKKNKNNKKNKKNEIKIDENLGEAIRTVVKENKAEKSEG